MEINMLNYVTSEELSDLGFKNLGSGWYTNESDSIRIRMWKDSEMDFWSWRNNQIHFRGKIYSVEDVKWVLERCF